MFVLVGLRPPFGSAASRSGRAIVAIDTACRLLADRVGLLYAFDTACRLRADRVGLLLLSTPRVGCSQIGLGYCRLSVFACTVAVFKAAEY